MIFDNLEIPYNVKASSDHVYLVANPGSNSIVIETTNPGFEQMIFSGEFKQQYVNYLRTSKLISESEYKNKSVEEIFEEKFKEVRDAEFNNLPGFQYYNKALTKMQNNDIEEALKLSQKAYFFYPDYQVKLLLHTCLLLHIEKCNFDKVSDIDYLAQFSRFENTDMNTVVGIFNNIIYHHLQYTDKEAFCDSLNVRLISQITDKKLIDEINFTYNLQMSYRYLNSDKVEKYVAKAIAIKGNHHDAKIIMENHLQKKLYGISNSIVLLDTINQMENRYDHEIINPILQEHKLRAYLQQANDSFSKKRISEGNKYLLEFEKNCEPPMRSQMLSSMIENTYRTAAVYYFYKGDKTTAKTYINRGLKYVPNSRLLESAVY
jgi:tetratricopeptide (TPR) repeat protein